LTGYSARSPLKSISATFSLSPGRLDNALPLAMYPDMPYTRIQK
jgi:hypothetical protein